jgi:hypothetical protein
MKRLLLFTVLSLLVAGAAFSQAGSIGIFPDAGGTGCDIVDAGGLVQVHYYHVYHQGATASQWMLDLSGLSWTHLGDTWSFPTAIGSSITGISLGYGSCMPAPTYLGVSNFFGSNAPTCSPIQIVADPASLSGLIEGVDCGSPANKTYPTGDLEMVNADLGCSCPGSSPVESTTWGSVKALYR